MSIESLTSNIEEQIKYYRPSEEVAKVLDKTVFVPVIGPFAVGKTVCIQQTIKTDQDFGYVQGFTTREMRPDEEPDIYRFLPHSEDSLKNILRSIYYGELVQVSVHPSTGHLYGSETSDYTKPYSMLDTLANAMDSLEKLPFGGIRPVGLVATKQTWWKRLRERATIIPRTEIEKRFTEAIASLEWMLEKDDLSFVNTAAPLEKVSAEVAAVAKGKLEPDARNRKVGEDLLRSIKIRTA